MTATIITISMADVNKNNNKRKQQKKNKAVVTRTTIARQTANRVAWQSR
jgi:hypothetical protein